jgi:hypothetical protein
MQSPEIRRLFREHDRKLERDLQRDKPKLFEALEHFANIGSDEERWAQFRKRWPQFFPEEEYDRAAAGSERSILGYPHWLDQIWFGGEAEPHLKIMLGIDDAPEDGTPEGAWVADLSTIRAHFHVDWDEGAFRYRGACDFQRALYLLFRESWRARICEKCAIKFIARRVAQKYCSTDCSESIQRELKQKWWAEHGETWRRRRKESKHKKQGEQDGTRKAR